METKTIQAQQKQKAPLKVWCYHFKTSYKPKLTRHTDNLIQIEYPQATKEEREQLISGLCSDKCWNEYLGLVF